MSQFSKDSGQAAFGHEACAREIDILAQALNVPQRTAACRTFDQVLQMGMEHFAMIGRYKKNSLGIKDLRDHAQDIRKVFLDAECPSFITRKRRRVQNDHVKTIIFLDGALQIFHSIRPDELILFGNKAIEFIIDTRPLEDLAAHIHIDHRQSPVHTAMHAESAGIREKIQNLAIRAHGRHTLTVGAHIQK